MTGADETDPPVWIGPYRLERELGRGSSGTVHLARASVGVERWVAVKRVPVRGDADARRTVMDEAAALAKLDHPNIVRLLDVVDDGDTIGLVTPFAANGSLAAVLAAGPLPPERVVELLAPIAAALGSAHRRGMVHGDVKPSNVLLTADGIAMLADFGLAQTRADAPDAQVAWERDQVVGSAAYLDPELAGGRPASPSSDLYALGVMAYEALTGRLPFDGPTAHAVLRAADLGDHEPLEPLRFGLLADAVEQAMARRARHRFADARAFERALRMAVRQPTAPSSEGLPLPRNAADDTAQRAEQRVEPRAEQPRTDQRAEEPTRATAAFNLFPRPQALADAAPVPRRRMPRRITMAALGAAATALVAGGAGVALHGGGGRSVEGGLVSSRAFCDPSTTSQCVSAVERTDRGVAITFAGDSEPTYFRVGEPQDALRVANWFCGQVETLAAYRPSTGVVYYFQRWPAPGETVDVVADATGIVQAGGVTVGDTDGDGCADLGIDRDGMRTWFLPVKQTSRLQRVTATLAAGATPAAEASSAR